MGPVDNGLHLCCEQGIGMCRICNSCGGSYGYYGGKMVKDRNWPTFIRAYDNDCYSQPAPRANTNNGYSLCCSKQPLC